jgi:histone acetyltransferase 1
MLILPPYQRQGLGAQLLQAVYRHYCTDARICDITVEDPSENFTK